MKSIPKDSISDMARFFTTGFMMGSADIVPGVSGGTIAFIMGIYKRLVESIKTVSGQTLKHLVKLNFKQALNSIPYTFLIPLLLGIATAIISLAGIISHLLETQPIGIWSFFFGLVLASIWIVSQRINSFTPSIIVSLTISAIIAYFIVGLVPVQTSESLLAFFISGAIAICAMILPGVSGSFMLVIMGKYAQVLEAVTQRDLLTLSVFFLGALVGLALFSRLLSYLFKHYHDLLVAALTGLMLGSLRRIWPYKDTVSWMTDRHDTQVPAQQVNILPSSIDMTFFVAVSLCLLGASIILGLSSMGKVKEA